MNLDTTFCANEKLSTSSEEKLILYMLIKNCPKEDQHLFDDKSFLRQFSHIALKDNNRPFYDNHVFLVLYNNNQSVSNSIDIQIISKIKGYVEHYNIYVDGIPCTCICFTRPFKFIKQFNNIVNQQYKSMDNDLKDDIQTYWGKPPNVATLLDLEKSESLEELLVIPKEVHLLKVVRLKRK